VLALALLAEVKPRRALNCGESLRWPLEQVGNDLGTVLEQERDSDRLIGRLRTSVLWLLSEPFTSFLVLCYLLVHQRVHHPSQLAMH
jgi:hypothetical protein